MRIFLEIVYVSLSTYVHASICDEIMIIIIPVATRCSNAFSWRIYISPTDMKWQLYQMGNSPMYLHLFLDYFILFHQYDDQFPCPCHSLNYCRQTYNNACQYIPTVIPPPSLFFFRDFKDNLCSAYECLWVKHPLAFVLLLAMPCQLLHGDFTPRWLCFLISRKSKSRKCYPLTTK